MTVWVVTYDNNEHLKRVKGVFQNKEDAVKYVEEVLIQRNGGIWDKNNSIDIIRYVLVNEHKGLKSANYKIQERTLQ